MSSRSYILQIILWNQSLKSISYSIINFPEQKTTDLRVKTWGEKDICYLPPMSKHGGMHHPHPPGIYALARE